MANKYDKLDYYKILEVSQTADEEAIRQKYRDLAKFWHPDHNSAPNALDMFQKLAVAYDVLKDPILRLRYTLLSIIYDKTNFPDMEALSIIRNMHGQEDVNLRAFHLTEITGKGLLHNKIDKVYYCSQHEAMGVIKNIAKHNWLYGFLGITAIFANIGAIINNILRINNKKDNLTLLLHNALAYQTEKKFNEAKTLAIMAKEYASKEENFYIDRYIDSLSEATVLNVRKWNFSPFKRQQLFYVFAFVFAIFAIFHIWNLKNDSSAFRGDNVKQVVVFNNGQRAYSDIAVAKIFDIPVDIYNKDKLYHLKETANAMHGADYNFDVFKVVEQGTTIRVIGYTADESWFKVMFDNGETAFIEASKLEQGIGKDIPLWSKIYKEN